VKGAGEGRKVSGLELEVLLNPIPTLEHDPLTRQSYGSSLSLGRQLFNVGAYIPL
jgi:hypothetical protein